MKIALFVPRYSISGVPLAQVRFARAFVRKGYDVDLVVGYVEKGLNLPCMEGVNLIVFIKTRVIAMLFSIYEYLKNNKPDIIFSAEDHLNAVLLFSAILARSKAKISVSSRVTPFDTYSDKLLSKKWLLKHFMRLVQPRADALTCVSEDMVLQYRKIFKNTRHQCVYNIVKDEESKGRMEERVDNPWITDKKIPIVIGAGQLAPWKGFSDLIMAVKLVNQSTPVRLIILGEGPLRGDLENLIGKEGLENVVRLIGFQDNPLKYYSKADVFVLSSYVEGLPNVLVEAMMCGCTPVATDCPTGPREVLQEGKYGYLVPVHDSKSMAEAIIKALKNPISPQILMEALIPFTEENVIQKHKQMLQF